MRPDLIPVETAEEFIQVAAQKITHAIQGAIRDRGHASVALAGGETPRPAYEELSRPGLAQSVPWSNVDLFFSDERCVPPEHPASNYRMVRESLLREGTVRPAAVHRMEADKDDRDRAAADYEALLPERLDVLVLGMGTDGHTGSLFPGSDALDENVRRVIPAYGGRPELWRITIGPRVVLEAHSVIVLISGEAKAEMVGRAVREPYDPKKIPIQLALGGSWIVDRAAATAVTRES